MLSFLHYLSTPCSNAIFCTLLLYFLLSLFIFHLFYFIHTPTLPLIFFLLLFSPFLPPRTPSFLSFSLSLTPISSSLPFFTSIAPFFLRYSPLPYPPSLLFSVIFHRLLQRYQNVKAELEAQQNLERIRLEKQTRL